MSRIIAVFLLTSAVFAQVALAPPMHPQFLTSSGDLLAGGFLYTYSAGSTSLLNTYSDSSGIIPNPDPIPLDASGAPSNGSVQVQIWLGNNSYKFCAFNSAMVQQWCSDNVSGYLGLLNLANTWTFQQTFTQPIVDTQTDNQIALGSVGSQTFLDFPPCVGNCTLHFPTTSGDILANPSPPITTPIVNGVQMFYTPGTYISMPNQSPTGTIAFTLAKFILAPSQAVLAATTDTSGIEGVVVGGAGTTGNVVIQQTGIAPCLYDGASTAGDYVQISATAAGYCHDVGGTYPTGGQVIGRVLSTNASPGYFNTELFGPEVTASFHLRSIASIFSVGSGAGTGATVVCAATYTCNMAGGVVQLSTGTSPAASQTILQVAAAASVTPFAVFCSFTPFPVGASLATIQPQLTLQIGNGNVNLVAGTTPLTGSTNYYWSYLCINNAQ